MPSATTTDRRSLLDVAGLGTGSTTLNDELRYEAYQEIDFMVTQGIRDRETLVPTENLIRTVRVTDRADVGPANDGNVSIADVHSVDVDEWLASFGRSSDRRVGVHGLPAATVHGGRQAA